MYLLDYLFTKHNLLAKKSAAHFQTYVTNSAFLKKLKYEMNAPAFHDIRSLSITWLENNNYDAQQRAAHAERQSTDTYKKGHVQWNEVPDKVVEWRE